jgi:hypothetical protein
MYLRTCDVAAYSYITNVFVQPFILSSLSHAIDHTVVALEPQPVAQLWHRHLGHAGTKTMDSIPHNARFVSRRSSFGNLLAQTLDEQHRRSSAYILTSVARSILRPIMVCSTFDEVTRFCCIYLLHEKPSSAVATVLRTWFPLAQNQANCTVKILPTDREHEYLELENVSKCLSEQGTNRITSFSIQQRC